MNDLSMPLYANKPSRKVPGTDVTAVTMYASSDRTVREYVLFDADGNRLGDVTSHTRGLARSAGYHLGHGVWRHDSVSFRNLTEAARYFLDDR